MSDLERPGVFEDADPDVWSSMSVGNRRLTWREAHDHLAERLRQADALAGVLADLDRCEHGRHEGDTCSGCGGPSKGNQRMQTSNVIGHGLAGARRPIVVPPREHRRNPQAWYQTLGDEDA